MDGADPMEVCTPDFSETVEEGDGDEGPEVTEGLDVVTEGPEILNGIKIGGTKIRRRKAPQQDIGKYLTPLRLPEHIKVKAAEIRRKMKLPMKRGNNLIKLVFYCVYNAYIEVKENFIIEDLSNICHVDSKDVSKILRMFPAVATGYSPPIDDKSALEFIPELFDAMKTHLHPSHVNEICHMADRVLRKSGELLDQEKLPENIAIAMILYYMDLNGICYEVSRTFGSSTIMGIKKIIGTVDNS